MAWGPTYTAVRSEPGYTRTKVAELKTGAEVKDFGVIGYLNTPGKESRSVKFIGSPYDWYCWPVDAYVSTRHRRPPFTVYEVNSNFPDIRRWAVRREPWTTDGTVTPASFIDQAEAEEYARRLNETPELARRYDDAIERTR